LDALSKTGGIMGIFYGFLQVVMLFIEEFFMYADLMEDLYKVNEFEG